MRSCDCRASTHCGFTVRPHALGGADRRHAAHHRLRRRARPRATSSPRRRRPTQSAATKPKPAATRAPERHRAAQQAAQRARLRARAGRRGGVTSKTATGAQVAKDKRAIARAKALPINDVKMDGRRRRRSTATARPCASTWSTRSTAVDPVRQDVADDRWRRRPTGWRVDARPPVRRRARAVGVHALQGPHEQALHRAGAERA